jgi:predicted permease
MRNPDTPTGGRTLLQTPRFTAVAVLILALAIGAATSLLSLVYAVLLKPLPFASQERLLALWENSVKHQFGLVEFSHPNFEFWQQENTVFETLAGYDTFGVGMSLIGDGAPVYVHATPVSPNYFSTFGTAPALGRDFTPADDRLDAPHVAVLSHAMWQQRAGGDPNIVGRQLRLDSDNYTVVGVMPEGFEYPRDADLWIPLVPAMGKENSELRLLRAVKGIGRLKPGATVDQAQTEVVALAKRLEKDHPETNDGISAAVVPLTQEIFGDVRPMFMRLLYGALLLLLMAAVTLAGLLAARHRDSGTGAGAGRLLADGFTLLLLGGLGGLLLAVLGTRLLRERAPEIIPRVQSVHLDGRMFLLTLVVLGAAMTALLMIPALRGGDGRLSRFLVLSKAAVALVLLAGAVTTGWNVVRLHRIDLGWDQRNVLTMRIPLPEKRYPAYAQRHELFERLTERIRPLPGVVSVATVSARPLDTSAVYEMPIVLKGQDWGKQITNPLTNFEAVSPSYFETLKIPLVKGRNFNAQDVADSKQVVIVSESLAARFWPGQDPLGKIVRQFLPENTVPWMVVVGMVRDARYRGLDVPRYDFYTPAAQNPLGEYMNYQDLVIRTSSDPHALAGPVLKALNSLDPDLSIASTDTLEEMVVRERAAPQFNFLLMTIFAFVALVLAAVGVNSLTRSRKPAADAGEVLLAGSGARQAS